jgi:acyl dehydratase
VGLTRTTGEIELTADDIMRIARQWDPQPFHVDAEAAKRSPLGGLTAAGCDVFCVATRLANQLKPLAVIAGLKQELEFPQPARPGDRLSLTSEWVAKRASESKPDRGIVIFQAEVRNQRGVTVLRMNSTLMLARRPTV